jgi:hypothetical protein
MHNHDTNETFIPMTGRWRASWENERGEVEHVDLGPLDVVSFPPGMIRRFENVTAGDPNEESILMFVIGGDAPRAEFTDQAMQQLEAAGVWSARCRGRRGHRHRHPPGRLGLELVGPPQGDEGLGGDDGSDRGRARTIAAVAPPPGPARARRARHRASERASAAARWACLSLPPRYRARRPDAGKISDADRRSREICFLGR